jgi:hypothetical protein
MPSPKTCEPHPASTDSVSSKPTSKKTTGGEKTFRSITKEHVLQALNTYLSSMMMINKNEEVTYFGIGQRLGEFEIKVEKMHD